MAALRGGRQWGWVSVIFAILALAEAGRHIEEESDDMLHLAPEIYVYNAGPLTVEFHCVPSKCPSSREGWKFGKKTDDLLFDVKLANDPPCPKRIAAPHGDDPPCPLFIAAPEKAGEYPVILFQHGYATESTDYKQIIGHVASHGFVVVAPRFTNIFENSDHEIKMAASVIDWFPSGLAQALSPQVVPLWTKLAIAGHSRGGKAMFGLATGVYNTSLKISAIAALDPVDGMSGIFKPFQTKPPIIHIPPSDLDLHIPALIVGTGLGSDKYYVLPACAPKGVSHQEFFDESPAPAFHFVASEEGHMDFLDDQPGLPCKPGTKGDGIHNFSAGIVVAFLQATLQQNVTQFCAAFSNYSQAPVTLAKPKQHGNFCPTSYPPYTNQRRMPDASAV